MSKRADELLGRIVLCRAWEKLERNPKGALVQASENLWAEVDEYLANKDAEAECDEKGGSEVEKGEMQVFIRTRDALAYLVSYLIPERDLIASSGAWGWVWQENTCESAGVPIPDTIERVCILQGNPGENPEDCTTHNHDLIPEAKDGVPEPIWILNVLDEATKIIDNKWQNKPEKEI